MRFRAAAVQFDPVIGRTAENVQRLMALNEEAADAGARLIVDPEMASCGYCFYDREDIAPYVETVPGPLTQNLTSLCSRFGCVIVCGLAEVEPESGLYFNTAVVVGPDGLIGRYRKTHLFVSDAAWSAEGDLGLPVWDTPVGRIGVEICMDAAYPEPARLLALQGAQIICFPTNWVGNPCPNGRWITRAFENGVYWIAADRAGEERGVQFMGGSCIIAPDGEVLALAHRPEDIVYADVDLSPSLGYFGNGPEHKLKDRRPDLYHAMLQNTYGWSANHFQTLYGQPGLPEPRVSHIGALQYEPRPACEDNLSAINELLAQERLDLVVLPELALPAKQAITLAADHDMLVVSSELEQSDGNVYHTVFLAGPNGILATHRKAHLTHDDAGTTPGSEIPSVCDTRVGRIGLAAGYDALFWETDRVLATLGADLICVPAALRWPRPHLIGDSGREWTLWQWRSWESATAIALANRPGPGYSGGSGIWIPQVREEQGCWQVAPVEGECLVTASLNTASRYIREKRAMAWRRLHWYKPLVSPPALPTELH